MAFTVEQTGIFWVAFATYLVGLGLIGWYGKKKTKTINDFMVANRGIGSVLTGLSYGVTYFSAVLLIGCPGLTWMLGSQWLIVTIMNLAFGTFGAFLLLGNRTRRMAKKLGAITLPELIAERYQDKKLIRPVAGLVVAVFQTIYLVSVLMGLSLLLQIMFPGFNQAYTLAVVLCGSITAIYLIIGGSHSAILSDLMESLVMVSGLVMIIVAGVWSAGGLGALNANILADVAAGAGAPVGSPDWVLNNVNSPDAWFLFPNALSMSMIGMALVTTFGTWGSPQMSTRFFATKNRRSIRYRMIISCMWVAVVSFCAWFAGYVGRGLLTGGGSTASLQAFADAQSGGTGVPANWYEYTVPWLIGEQGIIPLWMAALFLASVTAASLTTGEKLVLVASGSIGRDVYQKGIWKEKNVSDEKALKVTRISIVIIVAVGVILALTKPTAILDLCMLSWASLTAFTLIPFVAGLYWKGGTKNAALISGIIAMGIAVIWFLFFDKDWRIDGLPLFPRDNPQGLWDFSAGPGNVMLFEIPSLGLKAYPRDIHEFLVSQGVAIPIFFIVSLLDKKNKPDRAFLDDLFEDVMLNTNE